MKSFLIFCALCQVGFAAAHAAAFSVTNKTTGTLWTFDTNPVTGVARLADAGAGGVGVAAGTNVTAVTNGNLVTLSSGPDIDVAAGANVTITTNGNLRTIAAAAAGGGGAAQVDWTLSALAAYDTHTNYALDFSVPAWLMNPTSSFNFQYSTNGPGSGSTSRLITIFIPLTNFNRALTITNAATNWNWAGISQPFTVPSNYAARLVAQAYGPGETNVAVRLDLLNHQAGYSPYTAFNPSAITGLALWVKADTGCYSDVSGTVPCADGASVAVWKDQSGNGRNLFQAGTTVQPAFYSHATTFSGPAVKFGSSYLTNGSFVLTQPIFIFLVFWRPAPAPTYFEVLCDSTNATYLAQVGINNSPANQFRVYWAGSAIYPNQNTTAWMDLGTKAAGISSVVWTNGVQAITGTLGTGNMSGIILGAEWGSTAYNYQGYVAELLLYAANLSAQNVTDVQAYLRTKYGTP